MFTPAPRKHAFRALEKSAMRNEEDRYNCDNVYDIVRGALEYESMDGILKGAQMLANDPRFVIVRLKE